MTSTQIGSTLLLTGGSSGIGKCFLDLSKKNFEAVHTLGRQQIVLEEINHTHHFLDLKKKVSTQIDKKSLPQKIDALVLCAGSDINGRADFKSGDFTNWENSILINYLRPLELIHYCLDGLLKSNLKTLVAITSTNIEQPPKGCLAYTSAKVAFRSVLQNLRLEYAHLGLRVIEICPGITKTNFSFNRTNNLSASIAFYDSFVDCLNPLDVAQSILTALSLNTKISCSQITIQPTLISK